MHVQVPFPELLWLHPVNEFKDKDEAYWGTIKGIRPGAADLIFWWDMGKDTPFGVCSASGAIELKVENFDLTERQKNFRDKFKKCGGRHAVCRSVKGLRDTLISWGLECKNMVAIEPAPSFKEKQAFVNEMYKPN